MYIAVLKGLYPPRMLKDSHGRIIDYLRLAVTDRCNLRCTYCMPEQGLTWLPQPSIMQYEENLRLVHLLVGAGVTKVRITGGEPLVRKDLIPFLADLKKLPGLKHLALTTNGVMNESQALALCELGLNSVNLSLDTLDASRFAQITRRDFLPQVLNTLKIFLDHRLPVKINAVLQKDTSAQEILDLIQLAKQESLSLRFIEAMPFDGGEGLVQQNWTALNLLAFFKDHFPDLQTLPWVPGNTASNYQVPGFAGTLGIIAAYSRSFCGTCNRIRVTPQGLLKTCLYDEGVFNVKELMREGASDTQLLEAIQNAVLHKAKDGKEAEARRFTPVHESMATIGG